MIVKKFNENKEDLTLEELVSEMFFAKCDAFGSEKIDKIGINSRLNFYFVNLGQYEIIKIYECMKYVEDFIDFYIDHDSTTSADGLELNIILTKTQYDKLKEKIDMDNAANKYNL